MSKWQNSGVFNTTTPVYFNFHKLNEKALQMGDMEQTIKMPKVSSYCMNTCTGTFTPVISCALSITLCFKPCRVAYQAFAGSIRSLAL